MHKSCATASPAAHSHAVRDVDGLVCPLAEQPDHGAAAGPWLDCQPRPVPPVLRWPGVHLELCTMLLKEGARRLQDWRVG